MTSAAGTKFLKSLPGIWEFDGDKFVAWETEDGTVVATSLDGKVRVGAAGLAVRGRKISELPADFVPPSLPPRD